MDQALASAIFPYRDAFDVTAAQRVSPVEQSPLDHRGVRDDRAVTPDQRVHPAQRVLPVGVGEVTGERVGDHLARRPAGSLAVEIGGVDQAGGVYLGAHTPCLPALSSGRRYENGDPTELACGRAPGADARPRPVQPHMLAGPHLGDLVDVLVDHHANHRITAGDRVIRDPG